MITEKSCTKSQDDFAEKCKLALEKNWGIQIPKPKFNLKDNQAISKY